MFCFSCGENLPDIATFCIRCGKAQGSRLQQANEWQTCEIAVVAVKKSGLLTNGTAKWVANAAESNRQFIAAEAPFDAYVGSLRGIDLDSNWARNAFAVLTGQLVRDGWQEVSRGSRWWEIYYRRQK